MTDFDVIIIGAGAAGLMCAITASKRGRQVLVLEANKEVGKKILISGGGRCNFTNLNYTHEITPIPKMIRKAAMIQHKCQFQYAYRIQNSAKK